MGTITFQLCPATPGKPLGKHCAGFGLVMLTGFKNVSEAQRWVPPDLMLPLPGLHPPQHHAMMHCEGTRLSSCPDPPAHHCHHKTQVSRPWFHVEMLQCFQPSSTVTEQLHYCA